MTSHGPIKPWIAGDRTRLAETRIFSLWSQRFECPGQPERSGEFAVIDSPDWMNVVAITTDGLAIMVEQFRYGVGRVTLEPVAGMVEPGEDPLATAARELLEETGYSSVELPVSLGRVDANPAILNNRCHFAMIENATLTHEPSFDTHEQLRTRLIPIDEIPGLIRAGAITHSLAVCAFHFYFDYVRSG